MDNPNMSEKKQRKDRTVLYACLGAVVAGVLISLVLVHLFFGLVKRGAIEDTNGAFDTSLTTVCVEDVQTNRYSATMLQSRNIGSGTNVGGRLNQYDFDFCTVSARQISGVLTIQATNVDADELTLEIDTTLQSGNMEVFILVDGELAQQAEVNKNQTITLTDVAGKDVLVKIGAESAQMEISVKRTY